LITEEKFYAGGDEKAFPGDFPLRRNDGRVFALAPFNPGQAIRMDPPFKRFNGGPGRYLLNAPGFPSQVLDVEDHNSINIGTIPIGEAGIIVLMNDTEYRFLGGLSIL